MALPAEKVRDPCSERMLRLWNLKLVHDMNRSNWVEKVLGWTSWLFDSLCLMEIVSGYPMLLVFHTH